MSAHSEQNGGGVRHQLERQELLELLLKKHANSAARSWHIPRRDSTKPPRLSYAQERLWFLDQLGLVGSAYNLPLVLRLRGALAESALRKSVSALLQRHESLRTRFATLGGETVQVIEPARDQPLCRKDLSQVEPGKLVSEERRLIETEIWKPFDLATGPLLRSMLIHISPTEHVLILTMHHISSDGWSLQSVIPQDLAGLYEAFVHGRTPVLPELTIQYADYAVWQRAWLEGEPLRRQLAYWKDKLRGAPGKLELPTRRPRPPIASFEGAEHPFTMPTALSAALVELAERNGATLFMVLLTALYIVLWRWTGEEDVVVGSVVAGRPRRELEGLIGFFVNTLVLRTDLSGDPSFEELLRRVGDVALDAYAHQDVPFEKLVAELQPQRHLSHQPLFQVMLDFNNAPHEQLRLGDLEITVVEYAQRTAKFDLTLHLVNAGGVLRGSFEYAQELFTADTIEWLASTYKNLLDAAIADPRLKISRLSLLTPAQSKERIRIWSSGHRRYPQHKCVHELFAEQAQRSPDSIAVVCEGDSISYRVLNERACRLALQLHKLGVGPEVIVGLCADRSVDLVVGILAILKSGGAYLPLDPLCPVDRLAFMLRDAGARHVLTQRWRVSLFAAVPDLPLQLVYLEDCCSAQIGGSDAGSFAVSVQPANLMYCIYTSGSTGLPKGALISHENVSRLFEATRAWFQFDSRDVWTLSHSYAFDFSVWEIFGALLHGGKLVVVPQAATRSPEQLCVLLEEHGVTVLNQTPSAFKHLVPALEQDDKVCEHLRYVIFGGEALQAASSESWIRRLGSQAPALINMYGITETTVHVTYCSMQEYGPERAVGSPIGTAIPDLKLYLLDSTLQPVAPGFPGEIFVAGAGLARGYLGRGALTAERFLPDPFADAPGQRMYRSGDIARYRYGELEFVGRADHQVKVRGHRIELGEVETHLCNLPDVSAAIVRAVDTTLVGYVVPRTGAQIDSEALLHRLKQVLPSYMIPSHLVVIDEPPLTNNGKLDFARLPLPRAPLHAGADRCDLPRTRTEEVLLSVWEETLDMQGIGIHDNFFAVGGDSIRALEVARAATLRNLTISALDVFKYQTIAELAVAVVQQPQWQRRSSDMRLVAIPPDLSKDLPSHWTDAYPLTTMQHLMVVEYDKHHVDGYGVYHVQQSFRIEEPNPSPQAMREALELLVDAHPVMRTEFLELRPGCVVQGIRADAQLAFIEEDVSSASAAGQDHHIESQLLKDRWDPFTRSGTGHELLRVRWFRLTDRRYELAMSIHHAIDDGWGNQHFLSQLFHTYGRIRNGERVSRTPGSSAYKQFVALEHEARTSTRMREFWSSRKFHPGRFRTVTGDRCAEAVRGGSAPNFTMPLDQGLVHDLLKLSKRLQVSLKAVFLSAYLEALRDTLDEEWPTAGVVTNGRSDRIANPLTSLGLFWNMLPVAAPSYSSAPSARISEVQRQLVELEPHGHYPLSAIAAIHEADALFHATFNFINFHNAAQIDGRNGLQVLGTRAHDRFHYPLNYAVGVDRSTRTVEVHAEYDARCFRQQDVAVMSTRLLNILEAYRSVGVQ